MISTLFLLASIFGPASLALLVAEKRDKLKLFTIVSVCGIAFTFCVWFVNDSIPFTTGGDDLLYFEVSVREFKKFSDWFDFGQFADTHTQGGYPLLLAWVHQFAEGSLIHRKMVNVALFLCLAIVWFSIGMRVGGRRLAFVYLWAILLATPLWFYWLFLLKDMAIVLLQSLLLLGLVLSLIKSDRIVGYLAVIASSIAVVPFRSMLVVVNLAMLGFTAVLKGKASIQAGRSTAIVVRLAMAGVIAIGILAIAQRQDLLVSFGVVGADRIVSAEAIETNIAVRETLRESYESNPAKFVLTYLVGEVAAFNPRAWRGDTAALIRGISVIPWILIGLPLFLLGAWATLRGRFASPTQTAMRMARERVQVDRRFLVIFLVFVAVYAVVAWLAGDTTRWRMASFPPMIAIAGVSWLTLPTARRTNLLLIWSAGVLLFSLMYYVLK